MTESLQHSNVDHVAVAVYGMEHRQLDKVGDIPLSTDTQVARRFNIAYSHQVNWIPFFALDEHLINNCSGKGRPMCGTLGQEGGSVNYNYISQNPQIFRGTHVIVYPSFLHLVKMRVQRKQRLPGTINGEYTTRTTTFSPSQNYSLSLSLSCAGATRKLMAITKYLEDLRQTPEARVTGFCIEIVVHTNLSINEVYT